MILDPKTDLLAGLNPVQARGGRPSGRPAAHRGRRRVRQDPGAHPPHRLADRRAGRVARSRSWPSPSPTRPPRRCGQRVEALVGPVARRMWVSTFHAACVRILRRDAGRLGYKGNFTIYDQADAVRLTGYVIRDLDLDSKQFPPRASTPSSPPPRTSWSTSRPTPARARTVMERRVAEVYREYQQPPAGRQRHGLRRPAAGRRSTCCRPVPTCSSTTSSGSGTSWSTSTRTPTGPRTSWCSCSPAPTTRCRSSATATSRSTAGAGPTSATSWSSRRPSPTPPSSCWSRTTAPPRPSSTPPTRSSPTTPGASPRRCGPSRVGGEPVVRYHAEDEHDEGRWLAAEIAASTGAKPRIGGPLRVGRHGRLLPHQRPEPGDRGGAGPAGHPLPGGRRHPVLRPARRSRTCSPTCGPSPTRPTRCRSSASSTSPSAASATPAWPASTATPASTTSPSPTPWPTPRRPASPARLSPAWPTCGTSLDDLRRRAPGRCRPGPAARGGARADRVPGASC